MQVLHTHGSNGVAAAGKNGTGTPSDRKATRNSQLIAYEEKAKQQAESSLYGAPGQD